MDMTAFIATLIENIIREEFADVEIDSVRVAEALDYQDDTVFNVTVVFGEADKLDPQKTASIVRHIRNALLERGAASPFPIMSFVSRTDAAGLEPEAA